MTTWNRAGWLFLAAVLATVATCRPAYAWSSHTDTVAAVRAVSPPSADPSLADQNWNAGTPFSEFYDFTNRRAAAHATVAHLLYDDKNLYFSVHCDQAGIPIVAAQTIDHAGTATDDHVSLSLETSGSGGRVYRFSVTPRGIRDEYDSENSRYAPYWTSAAKVLPDGSWNAVMVVPLSDIRAQGGERQNWQINVVRYIAYTNDVYTWAFDGAMADVTSPQYWPHVTGLTIAKSSVRARPHADVYALGSAGPDRGTYQNGFGEFRSLRSRMIGADVTAPITNTLAFVGTINPDFSNVEQDQTTIAPQEFQRQYNEYRPFFAQGAGYLANLPSANVNSADLLFYSPTIGVFNRGLKLEGTQGLSQIGLMNVTGDGFNDSVLGYTWNKPDSSLTFAVNGVSANHGRVHDTALGYAVATANPHSGLFAIAHFASDRGSLIGVPSQANDDQFALGIQNSRTTAMLVYKDVGPQYAPIDGYIPINDVRGPQAFYQYVGAGSGKSVVKSYIINAGGDRFTDRSGAAHQVDVFSSASVTFTNLVQLEYSQHTSGLRFYGEAYPAYTDPFVMPFNAQKISFGYKDGTPAPLDASYSWGPFANNDLQPIFLQQTSVSTTRRFGRWGLSLEYDGVVEHGRPGSLAPALDSQWLRSAALTRTFGKDASFALGVRDVSGNGGYASPGTNLSFSYHQRFAGGNELYLDFGTPAATSTLDRWILKYVFHVGGTSGR